MISLMLELTGFQNDEVIFSDSFIVEKIPKEIKIFQLIGDKNMKHICVI